MVEVFNKSGYSRLGPKNASFDLGWSAFAGPVQTHRVDGDHRTMLFPPNASALANKVARICLNAGEKTSSEAEPS